MSHISCLRSPILEVNGRYPNDNLMIVCSECDLVVRHERIGGGRKERMNGEFKSRHPIYRVNSASNFLWGTEG